MQTADLFDHQPITRSAARERAMRDARARAEVGMARAADKAEHVNAGWCGMALHELRKFAVGQVGMWTIEQAREVIEPELPPVTDARAWGRVVQDASRRGYIEKTGKLAAAASSNGSGKPLWRRGPAA